MTFRIDAISVDGAGLGRWTCAFKGFRGQGLYGRALLDDSGNKLVLESAMDSNERLIVQVVAPPVAASRNELHAWIGEQLEALGLVVSLQVQVVTRDDGDEHVIHADAVAAEHALRLHRTDRAEEVGAVGNEMGSVGTVRV